MHEFFEFLRPLWDLMFGISLNGQHGPTWGRCRCRAGPSSILRPGATFQASWNLAAIFEGSELEPGVWILSGPVKLREPVELEELFSCCFWINVFFGFVCLVTLWFANSTNTSLPFFWLQIWSIAALRLSLNMLQEAFDWRRAFCSDQEDTFVTHCGM